MGDSVTYSRLPLSSGRHCLEGGKDQGLLVGLNLPFPIQIQSVKAVLREDDDPFLTLTVRGEEHRSSSCRRFIQELRAWQPSALAGVACSGEPL